MVVFFNGILEIMVEIEVYNDKSVIINLDDPMGKLPFPYQEALRNELSYKVPDSEWSAKYKTGQWDGKISLYVKRLQSFPTGLTMRVARLFDELNVQYKFTDKREKPVRDYDINCDFMGKDLRDYQMISGDLALKNQRGMLALATGAGKTMTSCYIFHKLKVKPVVFIVPAIELLKQTQKEFEKYLKIDGQPVKVGIAGGGLCDINMEGINVITYQTALIAFDKKYMESNNKIVEDTGEGSKPTGLLQKELDEALSKYKKARQIASGKLSDLYVQVEEAEENQSKDADKLRKKYEREIGLLIKTELAAYKKAQTAWDTRQDTLFQKSQVRNVIQCCNALIIDEAHLAAVVTEEIGNQAKNAYYRLGLSATPFRTDNQEIRIEGTLGGKVCEVSASDLVERGFLVPPKIFVVNISTVEPGQTYHEVYNLNIINCWERNFRIKQFAEGMKAKGIPTLILVERMEHGNILEGMIEDAVFVPGGDKGEVDPSDEEKNYRRRMLNAVENNEIILIATQWANVGVDAPKIAGLILAGTSSSPVTTYQQVGRVLRCVGKNVEDSIKNGKPEAIIIDFASSHKNLRSHVNMRKKVYKNERAWKMHEIK
jgi:superfamily II DNA or RNA helicase